MGTASAEERAVPLHKVMIEAIKGALCCADSMSLLESGESAGHDAGSFVIGKLQKHTES